MNPNYGFDESGDPVGDADRPAKPGPADAGEESAAPAESREPTMTRISGRPEPAPVPRPWGLARNLRRLAGVDEHLLAWVPQERVRYTGMGATVLLTATLALLSIFVALRLGFPRAPLWPLIVASALWFLTVLNIDRWIVSTPLSKSRWSRVPTLLTRLGIAFIFGTVIAEPLVLTIFSNTVAGQVARIQQNDLARYKSTWDACNPALQDTPSDVHTTSPANSGPSVSPSPTDLPVPTTSATPTSGTPSPSRPPASCAGFLVNAPTDVDNLADQLARDTAAFAAFAADLASDEAKYNELVQTSQDECLGKAGVGHTGIFGNGPVCKRLQQDARNYFNLHNLKAREAQRDKNTQTLNDESIKVAQAKANWNAARQTQINKEVDGYRKSQQAPGLLDQIEALATLSGQHSALAITIWLMRGLFILIDMAPALVKYGSGATVYDKLLAGALSMGEIEYSARRFEKTTQVVHWTDAHKRELALTRARVNADRAAEADQLIDALERNWIQSAASMPIPEPRGSDGPSRGWADGGPAFAYDATDPDLPEGDSEPPFDNPFGTEPADDSDEARVGLRERVVAAAKHLPEMNVVAIGGVGVGKTALLAAMFEQLEFPGNGYTLMCPDASQRDLLTDYARQVRSPGIGWPLHTNTDSIREFEFRCVVATDDDEAAILRINYWDYAGEMIEGAGQFDPEIRKELEQRVSEAHAVLIIVDGTRLRDALSSAAVNNELRELLTKCVRWASTAQCPAQIVVTKWDCLEGQPTRDGRIWDRNRLVEALWAYPAMRQLASMRRSGHAGGLRLGVRVIPVSVVGLGSVNEINGLVPLMEKTQVSDPVNVDVPFAGFLPDRLLQIMDDLGPATVKRRLRAARLSLMRGSWFKVRGVAASILRGLRIKARLGNDMLGMVEATWKYEVADWLAASVLDRKMSRALGRMAADKELLRQARKLKERAEWSMRAKDRLLSAFTGRLDRFNKDYPGRHLHAEQSAGAAGHQHV